MAGANPLAAMPTMDDDLARVELELRESVASENRYLTEISTHLIAAGGKRIRPGLLHRRRGHRSVERHPGEPRRDRRRGRRRARPPRLALPRRRHGRRGHPAHGRLRQRRVGQPPGHPRRRLPAGPRLGDRRLARRRGRRRCWPQRSAASARGRSSSSSTPTSRSARWSSTSARSRGRPRRSWAPPAASVGSWPDCPATTSRSSPSSAGTTGRRSRSSTTCSTWSPPPRSSASRPATISRRASTRCP